MAPKVFLTGATGFIGGDLLHLLSQAHPDWEITCIVRNIENGKKVAASYPNVRLIYGDNDSADLLEEESTKADIVYHTAASDDDEPSARAIAKGLSRSGGFWIHTSGGLILAFETIVKNAYGERFNKVFDDWEHLHELTSQPDQAPHRKVDKIVLAAGSDKVKTAIVAPAVVYGAGRGPVKTHSFPLWTAFMKHKKVFIIGKGENIWHYVHVQDLSNLYLLLGEAAMNGGEPATWNDHGYYLAEQGSYVAGEMQKLAAEVGFRNGLLSSPEVEYLSPDEADAIMPYARYALGVNSRGIAIRAKKVLGWKPVQLRFEDDIERAMGFEAKLLGIVN